MLSDIKLRAPDGVKLFSETADSTRRVGRPERGGGAATAGRPAASFSERHKMVVGLEVQRRADPNKPWSWCYYPGYLTANFRCESRLVIFTTKQKVTDWARGVRRILPSGLGAPLIVLGPDSFPASFTEEEAVARPELAFAHAIFYREAKKADRRDPMPLISALAVVSEAHEALRELCYKGLDTFFDGKDLREFMSNQGEQHSGVREYLQLEYGDVFEKAAAAARIEGEVKGRIEGRIEGKIEGEIKGEIKGEIRGILRMRQLSLTASQLKRLDEADLPTLRRWLERAPAAPTAASIFEEPS